MTLECSYTKFYAGSKKTCLGLLINVFYNAESSRYEAAVLEVDRNSASGYNSEVTIVPVDGLSITPRKG